MNLITLISNLIMLFRRALRNLSLCYPVISVITGCGHPSFFLQAICNVIIFSLICFRYLSIEVSLNWITILFTSANESNFWVSPQTFDVLIVWKEFQYWFSNLSNQNFFKFVCGFQQRFHRFCIMHSMNNAMTDGFYIVKPSCFSNQKIFL